jgi:hypothetical protein
MSSGSYASQLTANAYDVNLLAKYRRESDCAAFLRTTGFSANINVQTLINFTSAGPSGFSAPQLVAQVTDRSAEGG